MLKKLEDLFLNVKKQLLTVDSLESFCLVRKTITDFFGEDMTLSEFYGIRAFYGLSSNNEIKYTDEWYNSMLELETRVGTIDDFKKVSFFNHLIFTKN